MSMSDGDPDDGPPRPADRSQQVAWSSLGDGFAHVAGQVLVRGEEGARRLEHLVRTAWRMERGSDDDVSDGDDAHVPGFTVTPLELRRAEPPQRQWWVGEPVPAPLAVIEALRAEGYDAQPNHAFFAHGCGSPCPPHPAVVHELVAMGLSANPLRANPLRANPLRANPLRANPLRANNPMENDAVPADGREFARRSLEGPHEPPRIFVLDTGVAQPAGSTITDHTPPLLRTPNAPQVTGELDLPDGTLDATANLVADDGYLDPVAGHGTFIAGIIEQLAPGCPIDVRRVISVLGVATEDGVAETINRIVDEIEDDLAHGKPPGRVIISMSFGGQTLGVADVLHEAVSRAVVTGIAVVASAGNDAVCIPQYPAAFPNVVAVAALGPDGPAPWTNYGDWVDACAPGTDLVSAFFDDFDGQYPTMNTHDPDRFTGWARWSGTSFAVPVVVAAIAREIVTGQQLDTLGNQIGPTARKAVDRVVRAPHLLRLPCLGTVVNI